MFVCDDKGYGIASRLYAGVVTGPNSVTKAKTGKWCWENRKVLLQLS